MNYLPEEHRIRLFQHNLSRDSFAGLWNSIAMSHHFLKLTFSEAPTKEQIDSAISHQSGSVSPYSLRVFDKYDIIYQKRGTIIITNPSVSGKFFAVEDSDCPHRYFVGFCFSVGSYTESITGMILYFDEKGYCYSDRTIICQRVVATYDTRNGVIRQGNSFMYHQTLLFTITHRDTHRLMIYVSYIPYSNEQIEDFTSYYTNFTVSNPFLNKEVTLFHRFLMIPLDENKTCHIDMGSLALCEERHIYHDTMDSTEYQVHRYFQFNSYLVMRTDHIRTFLEVASLFPEKEYSDGYPLFCIKCNIKTVAATYRFKSNIQSTTYMGLGSSYCPHCRIRYSDSKKSWLCAEVRIDGIICDGYFHSDWICQSDHLHAEDQTLLTIYDSPYLKYPYRKRIHIQWVPSDEAMELVKTAKRSLICSSTPSDVPHSSDAPHSSDGSFFSSNTPPYLLKDECP